MDPYNTLDTLTQAEAGPRDLTSEHDANRALARTRDLTLAEMVELIEAQLRIDHNRK